MAKKIIFLISLFLIFDLGLSSINSTIDSLKLEIEKNPNDYQSHYRLGFCYQTLSRYNEALQEFNCCLESTKDFKKANSESR